MRKTEGAGSRILKTCPHFFLDWFRGRMHAHLQRQLDVDGPVARVRLVPEVIDDPISLSLAGGLVWCKHG